MLLKNEDLYVERVIENVRHFCDEIRVVDNFSKDRTWDIVRDMAGRDGRIHAWRSRDTAASHEIVAPLAGSDTWVFGVDGDEIYDPEGLARFRNRLLRDEFTDYWQVFGNVLNCVRIDAGAGQAAGYLAPPCRSMVKLYNFGAIESWDGPCAERFHGGRVRFRDGFGSGDRCQLHEHVAWADADLRCLHLCFVRRSSRDRGGEPRSNIVEQRARRSVVGRLRWLWRKASCGGGGSWKLEKYGRGPLVEMDVSAFFPGG